MIAPGLGLALPMVDAKQGGGAPANARIISTGNYRIVSTGNYRKTQ